MSQTTTQVEDPPVIDQDGRPASFMGFHPQVEQPVVPYDAAKAMGASAGQDLALGRVILAQRVSVPRREAVILQRIELAAKSAGDAFYWGWEVNDREGGGKKWIEGPSIDCAMAVAAAYQNCSVRCHVDDYADHWMMRAEFVDYETGFTLERTFFAKKPKAAPGRFDGGRWLEMQFGAAQSKAVRNVVVQALARYCDYGVAQAKTSLINRVRDNQEGAIKWLITELADLGVDLARAGAQFGGVLEKGKILPEAIARMMVVVQSIKSGQSSVEEAFPDPKAGAAQATADAQAMAGQAARAPAAPPPAADQPTQKREQAPRQRRTQAPAADAPATTTTEPPPGAGSDAAASDPAPTEGRTQAPQEELTPSGPEPGAATAPPPADDAPPPLLGGDDEGDEPQAGMSFT